MTNPETHLIAVFYSSVSYDINTAKIKLIIMKTLHVLAIAEVAALAVSKFMQLHDAISDAISYTIVGMMIVTFGYLFENFLAGKKDFPHRRKVIVVAIFAIVLLVYWLLKFI